MVCENSKKAIVTYTFNESDRRQFVTEDVPITVELKEYRLPVSGGQCPISYDVTVFFGHECTKGQPKTGTLVTRVPNKVLGTEMKFVPDSNGSTGTAILIVYYMGGQRGGKAGDNIFGCSGGIGLNAGNYFAEITNIVPAIPGQADNCGSLKKCQLIVKNSKSNIVIFKDEGDCPCTYSIDCEFCPPNTHCQCDHGDVICCYDINGIVIETIRKS